MILPFLFSRLPCSACPYRAIRRSVCSRRRSVWSRRRIVQERLFPAMPQPCHSALPAPRMPMASRPSLAQAPMSCLLPAFRSSGGAMSGGQQGQPLAWLCRTMLPDTSLWTPSRKSPESLCPRIGRNHPPLFPPATVGPHRHIGPTARGRTAIHHRLHAYPAPAPSRSPQICGTPWGRPHSVLER